jgi:hypothetical protein
MKSSCKRWILTHPLWNWFSLPFSGFLLWNWFRWSHTQNFHLCIFGSKTYLNKYSFFNQNWFTNTLLEVVFFTSINVLGSNLWGWNFKKLVQQIQGPWGGTGGNIFFDPPTGGITGLQIRFSLIYKAVWCLTVEYKLPGQSSTQSRHGSSVDPEALETRVNFSNCTIQWQ